MVFERWFETVVQNHFEKWFAFFFLLLQELSCDSLSRRELAFHLMLKACIFYFYYSLFMLCFYENHLDIGLTFFARWQSP